MSNLSSESGHELVGATERLWSVVNSVVDGIINIDERGTIVTFNLAAERIFGYPASSVIGQNINVLMPEPYRGEHDRYIANYLATGQAKIIGIGREVVGLRKGGTTFPMELAVGEFRFGERRYFTGIVRDISERKRSEEALRASNDLLRAVIEGTTDLIFAKDREGRYLMANTATAAALGRRVEEVLGRDDTDLFPPETARELRTHDLAVMESGETRTYEESATAAGVSRVFLSTKSPYRDAAGAVAGVVGISRDITDWKREVTERKRAEQHVRLLLESTDEGLYGLDIQGHCTFINQAAAAMFGYDPAEVIGKPMHELIHHHRADRSPYHMEACLIYRALRVGEGARVRDEVFWRKDGTSFPVEYSSFPIRDDGAVSGAVVAFTDVTERRRLEEQLRQAQKMEAVGQLAGGVAHDFNNLLTIISGYTDLLLSRFPQDDPARGLLKEIYKAGERAASLTRQLLAFSRKQIVEPKVLDLNAIVGEAGKMLRRLIGEDVNVATVLAPDLGAVKADPGQVEQVLMNLAVNARDAMPQGGRLTIETANVELDEGYARAHVEVKPGRYAMLAMSDTGHGMTEEVRARVFEPFFTTKEPGKGTGLGLATVHGIVKQAGGHVAVYSEPGQGTTFKVYLPLVREQVSLGKSYPSLRGPLQGTETVLVVEDEPAVRSLTRHALQMYGYRVLEAGSGQEALRIGEQQEGPIHLLVTDVVMPGMSGRQVADALFLRHPQMRVLFLSGYTDDAVVRHGILQAEVAFLQKPFTPIALAAKVREVLGG